MRVPGVFFMRVAKPAGFKGILPSPAIACTPPVDSLVRPAVSGCRSETSRFATVPVPNTPKLSDSLFDRGPVVSRTFRHGGLFRTTLEPPAYVSSTGVFLSLAAAQRTVVKRSRRGHSQSPEVLRAIDPRSRPAAATSSSQKTPESSAHPLELSAPTRLSVTTG